MPPRPERSALARRGRGGRASAPRLAQVARGGRVGTVRILEVHPEEDRAARLGAQQGEGAIDGRDGPTLGQLPNQLALLHDVVVDLEALGPALAIREALLVAQGVVAHDRHRGIAGSLQLLGQCVHSGRKGVVLEHASLVREEAGEEAGEARPRLRRMGLGALEDQRARRQLVEVRRGGAGVAVDAQVVGAQRVHRDEHDGGLPGSRGRRRERAAAGRAPRAKQKDRRDSEQQSGQEHAYAGSESPHKRGSGQRRDGRSRTTGFTRLLSGCLRNSDMMGNADFSVRQIRVTRSQAGC